jgi:uncharacterized protein YebE (UPF0316 family)
MPDFLLLDSAFFTWFLLPLLIFIARVADVSLGTVRVIFIARGLKYFAPVVGFFEIIIWLLAIGQIMQHLSSPLCYIAYAGGFATGNYVGMWIAEKLSLGVVLIRVITSKDASELLEYLRTAEYGVTSVDAQGSSGKVQVVFTIVRRREVASVVNLIKQFNPKAFYTIEEVGFVEEGIFPARKTWLSNMFRPFRKGK